MATKNIMTTAINMFIEMTLRNKIPFELTGDHFYNAHNVKYLEDTLKEIKSGRKYEKHELFETDDVII